MIIVFSLSEKTPIRIEEFNFARMFQIMLTLLYNYVKRITSHRVKISLREQTLNCVPNRHSFFGSCRYEHMNIDIFKLFLPKHLIKNKL